MLAASRRQAAKANGKRCRSSASSIARRPSADPAPPALSPLLAAPGRARRLDPRSRGPNWVRCKPGKPANGSRLIETGTRSLAFAPANFQISISQFFSGKIFRKSGGTRAYFGGGFGNHPPQIAHRHTRLRSSVADRNVRLALSANLAISGTPHAATASPRNGSPVGTSRRSCWRSAVTSSMTTPRISAMARSLRPGDLIEDPSRAQFAGGG
jgi:hypothetical protein